ncbi:T9SS C-terminal target domain-containing protein [Lutibacter sp. HS1-25]|uniref:T9SS type A sorting domain-containing protein n=1 Tax=Lutibacter sp. HS1-25 TaxID=2485000 RepID=UPI0010129402|nr:T9SS type A sorting domain-containing protein [Lutibacter sp. HS1-25]RXP62721.1 T9SS C-terminal target domain-containing protein [Lutibacter sp. HS1-25]
MKKITFMIATLFSLVAYSQSTFTEDFSSEILVTVPQDASNPGLDNSYISAIAAGDGKWFSIAGFGTKDFDIQTTGGNSGAYVSRVSETQFARAFAYVYNNSDNSVSGAYDLNFDYFFNTSFDNASTTNDRFGYKIYGMTDATVAGSFVMTSGSGDFGDNNAANYNDIDFVQLKAYTHLPHSDSWANSGSINVDFGASGTYKYIVIVWAQVFGTAQTGNPVASYFGVDNVKLPTQSNPQPTSTLSTKDIDESLFSIAPNPATSYVTINNLVGNFSYKIYNVTGKLVKSVNTQVEKTINISDLISGVYILEITNEDNVRGVQKLIKL